MANQANRVPLGLIKLHLLSCVFSLILVFAQLSSLPIFEAAVSRRPQRQILTDELSTGLTGTGTSHQNKQQSYGSFNSYGQSTWQQQQQQTTGYDDIPDSPFYGRYPSRGNYPTSGYGSYGVGIGGSTVGPRPAYGGGGGGYGTGIGSYGKGNRPNWRGFGGKTGYAGGGYNQNRLGTKY